MQDIVATSDLVHSHSIERTNAREGWLWSCDPYSRSNNIRHVLHQVHLASFSFKMLHLFLRHFFRKRVTMSQIKIAWTWFKAVVHEGPQRCFCPTIKVSHILHFNTDRGSAGWDPIWNADHMAPSGTVRHQALRKKERLKFVLSKT